MVPKCGKDGKPERSRGPDNSEVGRSASSTSRKVRLAFSILFLLLAAALFITSLTLVPVRKAKFRACLRDGLHDGAISPAALNSTEGGRSGLSEYDYFYAEIGYENYPGDPQDPYIAKCQDKYGLHEYRGPIAYTVTALIFSILFAVVLFTHTSLRGVSCALVAVLVAAAAWTVAYAVPAVSQKKFRDCLKDGLASGAIVDEWDEYQEYYDDGADPFGEHRGSALDPGIRKCQEPLPSTRTVFGLFAFAVIIGCIVFLYLLVAIGLVIRRCCSTRTHQAQPGKLSSEEAGACAVDIRVGLPTSVAAPDEIVVPVPPSKG